MARTLILWALIALVPAINVRMICFEHPVETSAASECDDQCPRKKPASDDDTTGCVLVAGGCSALTAFVAGLPAPSAVALARPSVHIVDPPAAPDLYLPPLASPLSPPPKA